MTRYVVLRLRSTEPNEVETWELGLITEAASAESAVRETLRAVGDSGTYVAVPERSWRPLKVEVETERRVRVKESA